MNADQVLESLGRFGTFQVLFFLCVSFIYMRGAWPVMGILFLGGDPGHHCQVWTEFCSLVMLNIKNTDKSHFYPWWIFPWIINDVPVHYNSISNWKWKIYLSNICKGKIWCYKNSGHHCWFDWLCLRFCLHALQSMLINIVHVLSLVSYVWQILKL